MQQGLSGLPDAPCRMRPSGAAQVTQSRHSGRTSGALVGIAPALDAKQTTIAPACQSKKHPVRIARRHPRRPR
ncbi:hypothetical protein D8I24_2998 (plasmid) [Cupriavidus necator H850]|nr:hypothetical protein D8I24_2998 [Cupriavidus necator H850]